MCKDCECHKQYYAKNKDKIIERSLDNYNKNKEEKLKKMKEYRESHKEKINAKANEKVACVCGGRYTVRNKSTHLKSKKHVSYVEKEEVEKNENVSS